MSPAARAEDVLTYSVSPRWRVSADTMLYARVASGYRPGGPNPRALDLPPTVSADTLTNYELGAEDAVSGRPRASSTSPRSASTGGTFNRPSRVGGIGSVDNTGNAVSKGFELETAVLARRSACASASTRRTRDARLTAPAEGIAAARLGNTPRWSASAVLDYEFALANRWTAHIGGGWRYVGEQGTAIAAQTGADNSYVLPSVRRARSGRRPHARQLDDPALRPQRHRSARLHRRRSRRRRGQRAVRHRRSTSCSRGPSESASTSVSERCRASGQKQILSEKFVRIGLPGRLTGIRRQRGDRHDDFDRIRPAPGAVRGCRPVGPAALAAAATAQTSTSVSVLEEVVVTAQKFEQKLSETPLSVTAISARNLEALGATQFRDFASTVPSLTFTTSGVGSTQVNLRGITTGNNISPTVGIYVDEVPYGSSTPFASGAQLALDVGLFDVSRIEILRGPQGTLYGASTMGGLLKYVSVTAGRRRVRRDGARGRRRAPRAAASATTPPLRSTLRSPTTRPRFA